MSVSQRCIGSDILQIPTAVLQLVYLCLSRQATLVRQEVGTVALGFHVGSKGVDRVARHEVMQVQAIDADIGIVGHSLSQQVALGIKRYAGIALEFNGAGALASHQISSVTSAVGLQRTVNLQSVWYAVVTHQRWVYQSKCKIDVLCPGTHFYVCLHTSQIGYVIGSTAGSHTEGCGQMDVESRKGHVLHIAVDRAFDADGVVRIVLDERLRHATSKAHHILLAYLCIQAETHGSGIQFVESIEVHSQLGIYLCVRRFQFQRGYHQVLIIHGYLGREVADLQSTLFLGAQMAYHERCVWLDILYGVNA